MPRVIYYEHSKLKHEATKRLEPFLTCNSLSLNLHNCIFAATEKISVRKPESLRNILFADYKTSPGQKLKDFWARKFYINKGHVHQAMCCNSAATRGPMELVSF